jgi:Domain of unknown function (DUF4328)/Septum formation
MTTTERTDEGAFLPPVTDGPRLPPRALAPPPPPPLQPAPITTWAPATTPSRPAAYHRYRSPRLIGGLCSAASVVSVGAAGVAVASTIRAIQVMERLENRPLSLSVEDVRRTQDHLVAVSLVQLGAWVLAVVFLIAVTRRLYGNLRAISTVAPRFSNGWAIGAWFVPFLNFVRPKQIVDEIWLASSAREPGQLTTPRVPTLVHVWWLTWLAAVVASRIGALSAGDADLQQASNVLWLILASELATLVFSLLTVVVVHRLVVRQRRRAAEVLGEEHARPVGRPTGGAWMVASAAAVVGVAAIAGGLVAFAPVGTEIEASGLDASTVSSDDTGGADDSGGRLFTDLVLGDCLDLPSDVTAIVTGESVDVLAAQTRPCTAPHDAEVIAVLEHPAPAGAAYPGEVALFDHAASVCMPEFESVVGIAFYESALDIFTVVPTDGWQFGDRQITCVVNRIDGQKLTATVVDAAI